MKKVLYVIVGLLVIYLVLCMFGPSRILVERSIVINAPAENIKAAFTDFKFFRKNWSPWTEKDPSMTIVDEGESGKPGSKYSWVGNKEVGTGTIELLSIDGDTVVEKLTMKLPREMEARIFLITKTEGSATNVKWGMKFLVSFFGRAPMLFMSMDKMMGPDFENGLAKLKTVMEAMPAVAKTYKGYEIKEIAWEEKNYIGKKETVAFEKLSAFFAETYPKLGAEFGKNKIEMIGAPSCIYFSYDETGQKTECAAVFGCGKGIEIKGWQKFTIQPCPKVLHIAYYGPYNEQMKAPHEAMDEYMKEKGLTQNGVVEEYVTDPGTEKDSTKWLTNIYYIIK